MKTYYLLSLCFGGHKNYLREDAHGSYRQMKKRDKEPWHIVTSISDEAKRNRKFLP